MQLAVCLRGGSNFGKQLASLFPVYIKTHTEARITVTDGMEDEI